MKDRLHILRELARYYERTQAGRTGVGERDLLLDYEEFFRAAGCADGETRHIAERELMDAGRIGLLTLVTHRRDPKLFQQIRFSREKEALLFARLGEPSPTERRNALAQQFRDAASSQVLAQWREPWERFCAQFADAAQHGESVVPFERAELALNAELLSLMPQLLAWKSESLMRFASCVLCGDSKRLESLSGRLGQILNLLTHGKFQSLEELGIFANPRFVLVHGPLRLHINGQPFDLSILAGPCRLSEKDITRAEVITTSASRCLTVENETTFHELAKLQSGELLVQTSFPGSGTLTLLERLPKTLAFWHFGDTDPEGYEILRDLRERTRMAFRALHMHYRPLPKSPCLNPDERRKIERLLKSPAMSTERSELEAMYAAGRLGRFEQESLGLPSPAWPFYENV
ncbi:MAG TPA: Wadjet anti-phage system protein JetD domain-containing protein [Verrucomicrobiae bacterium]|nr:Wadjet anti-phage system protein JetD domain-containing protein [Verrucomicrobiae bacterium]